MSFRAAVAVTLVIRSSLELITIVACVITYVNLTTSNVKQNWLKWAMLSEGSGFRGRGGEMRVRDQPRTVDE